MSFQGYCWLMARCCLGRCELQAVLPHGQPPGNVPTMSPKAREHRRSAGAASCENTAGSHTRGEFLLPWISSAAPVTSYAETANPGPIYQAIHSDSQVRLIIKTLPLSLWGSPGFCLMQQTDGTEEIQVVCDEIWGFFHVVARIFQID